MRPAEARLALLLAVAAGASACVAALAQGGVAPQALDATLDGPTSWNALLGSRPHVPLGDRAIVVLKAPSLAQGGDPAGEVALQNRVAARFGLEPQLRFTHVLDGFSAEVDPGRIPLVESDPAVAGVYPVRAAYPAYVSTGATNAATIQPPPGGLDGRGVPVALIAPPGGPSALAAVLAQAAPGAAAIPVTVGPRSDQVLAGLERAVALRARIAVVGVAEPYAGFPDSPEARAAAGAAALGTLVVAAAGDDGFAAGSGDLSAWAAAPDALGVAAADTRPSTALVHVEAPGWAGTVTLAGGPAPSTPLSLPLAAPTRPGLLGFFSGSGASLVAGRAAVVPSAKEVADAVRAGARAVVIAGGVLPSGSVSSPVPVVALPLVRGGSVTIAPAGSSRNPGRGRLASFSSTGPTTAVAAGVALRISGGRTLTGTGAAAAVAAGRAAISAEATPSASAADLRASLAPGGAAAGRPPRVPLLGNVHLTPSSFAAADTAPALLGVEAGRVVATTAGPEIVSLSRLDVELWRGSRYLGTLARIRDVLPGRYTFGLTGRSPAGAPLPPGEYTVVVVARSVEGGSSNRRMTRFSLR
ncbi:MAG: S8 family serine peptidase [Actinobacteria bacterium]|nr:S8 family serine peptidase [Actinomycetota bacterium]